MTWLWFVVAAFATYYTARAISQEDGPFGVFDRLRSRLDTGYLGKGIRCIVCVGAYTGLAMTALLYLEWYWPVIWLGLAGASVLIDKVWKR